ncbi:MAG: hypothetical protein CVU11_14290 [Bacteroidetes bacterium HGW-Bacteroidetes-6]|nr:MAG: hypothetical protein CVU11_14290 [Bacteroidetes bacterium HGW-Bacteroidetes-6]
MFIILFSLFGIVFTSPDVSSHAPIQLNNYIYNFKNKFLQLSKCKRRKEEKHQGNRKLFVLIWR